MKRRKKQQQQQHGSLFFKFLDTLDRLTQPINQRYWQREQNLQIYVCVCVYIQFTRSIYSCERVSERIQSQGKYEKTHIGCC